MTQDTRNWQSVRTILEALILAALLWSAKAQVSLQTQVAVLAQNVASLSAQLGDIPSIRSQLAENAVQIKRNQEDIAELRQTRGAR